MARPVAQAVKKIGPCDEENWEASIMGYVDIEEAGRYFAALAIFQTQSAVLANDIERFFAKRRRMPEEVLEHLIKAGAFEDTEFPEDLMFEAEVNDDPRPRSWWPRNKIKILPETRKNEFEKIWIPYDPEKFGAFYDMVSRPTLTKATRYGKAEATQALVATKGDVEAAARLFLLRNK